MVTVSLAGGLLTLVAGGYLLSRLVMDEAQRRIEIALKTARSGMEDRGSRAQMAGSMAAELIAFDDEGNLATGESDLERLRVKGGFDYIHVIGRDGKIIGTARGSAVGRSALGSSMVREALGSGAARTGYRLVPLIELSAESPDLAERALVRPVDTPHARTGGPEEPRDAMVLEAVIPVVRKAGAIEGAVRVGLVLDRNDAIVDDLRQTIFTMGTYGEKNLGTVTIFQDDVRISTNVLGLDGQRAIGTRVSEIVYNQVMGEGRTWIGPAFVVDTWYISAYEPILDENGKRIGMLYVGILKQRYDDMMWATMGGFLALGAVVLLGIAAASVFSANMIARPITRLAEVADQVAGGDFSHELDSPGDACRYEIHRLYGSFGQMVRAVRNRDEQLRASLEEIQKTSEELRRWNQNYLNTLEFITHELKNQIAAMKINVLALHDGFVGEMTEEQIEALDDVHASIVRTEEMILNYLNLSRIEKGELEVRARPVMILHDVLTPVMRDLRGRFDEKAMTVELELPEDLCVQADPTLLQIVYENLMGNAAKYGEYGGVVTASGSRTADGMVELRVRNTGPGVPANQVRELFQKFSRVSRPGELERGSGLGLYITREIIRKHGGDIDVVSREDEWIEFVFTLPRPDTLSGAELIGSLDDEDEEPGLIGFDYDDEESQDEDEFAGASSMHDDPNSRDLSLGAGEDP